MEYRNEKIRLTRFPNPYDRKQSRAINKVVITDQIMMQENPK